MLTDVIHQESNDKDRNHERTDHADQQNGKFHAGEVKAELDQL